MTDESGRVPATPPPAGVTYDPEGQAPGSTANFMVWLCNGPTGYRTVVYIQKALAHGTFTAFDFIDDGQIGIPCVGDDVFVALHGTKHGADVFDVVYLYAVSPNGALSIGFPEVEFAKGYRTAQYLGNNQVRVWKPDDPVAWARRYCWNGAIWTQGADAGPNPGCDPNNPVVLTPPSPAPHLSNSSPRYPIKQNS